jgi:hypothetical protein
MAPLHCSQIKFLSQEWSFHRALLGRVSAVLVVGGQECFGWQEAGHCTPEGLAELFVERFRAVCEAGRGRDWEYAGWLTELIGHVS